MSGLSLNGTTSACRAFRPTGPEAAVSFVGVGTASTATAVGDRRCPRTASLRSRSPKSSEGRFTSVAGSAGKVRGGLAKDGHYLTQALTFSLAAVVSLLAVERSTSFTAAGAKEVFAATDQETRRTSPT